MRTSWLCLAAAFIVTAPASAQVVRPWFALTGSWATYSMKDVNREIADVNAALADSGLTVRMDEINSGVGFGVTAGLDLPSGVTLGLGYERLSASTEINDPSVSLAFKLPANAFSLRGSYRLPAPGVGAFSLGLGLGVVSEAGALQVNALGVGAFSFDLEGSGLLLEPFASGDWSITPQVSLEGMAGYRRAKISKVKVLGGTLYNPDGSRYSVDYSGPLIRLGLKLGLLK